MKLQMKKNILVISDCDDTSTDALFAKFRCSKKTRYCYYRDGLVHVNRKLCKQNTLIKKNDVVEFHCSLEDDDIIPCFQTLSIIYEDELFLIVDKPCDMLIHSDGINLATTLSNIVKGYYITSSQICPVRPIHRLDKDTTGLVIFCKIPLLQPLLDWMLKEKEIERQYYALCVGVIKGNKQTITKAIAKNRHDSHLMRISSTGKEASTTIFTKKNFIDYTWIECHLHSGRTHQIRVHLASINHPLMGDSLYGQPDSRIPRVALHAYKIKLYHPFQQTTLEIECPLPYDMKRLL